MENKDEFRSSPRRPTTEDIVTDSDVSVYLNEEDEERGPADEEMKG